MTSSSYNQSDHVTTRVRVDWKLSFKDWTYEFASTLCALGLLGAVVAVLFSYDGRAQSSGALSLNTFLSVVGLLTRMLLIFPVVEGE